MFTKLKERWKVNGLNLLLIITTFALGGSLCGWAGRKLLILTNIENRMLWLLVYILLVTILWPLAVLLVSIPLGQFNFFKNYIVKIAGRFGGSKKNVKKRINIAIFASGAGSNAAQIINFKSQNCYKVALIVSNKPDAGVLDIAAKANIPTLIIGKDQFFKGDNYITDLQLHQIEFIVLAGFLWKIHENLIKAFPKKIINIHPALLPAYGGKGMYGHNVHQAVIDNKEKESGITIHYVDEHYDHGEIIFQAKCPITENDTAVLLANKIHALEHQHYPQTLVEVLKKAK